MLGDTGTLASVEGSAERRGPIAPLIDPRTIALAR